MLPLKLLKSQIHLFFCIQFLYATISNGQSCNKYQCSKCQITFIGSTYNRPYRGCAYSHDEYHEWNNVGVDYECVKVAQTQKEEKERTDVEFDKKKEKIKDGQEVIRWYNSGKAYISQKDGSYTQYTPEGIIDRVLNNGTLIIYKDGKPAEKGSGGYLASLFSHDELVKNGIWFEGGKRVYYNNGIDISEQVNNDWSRASSKVDYENFIKKYPLDNRVSEAKTKIARYEAETNAESLERNKINIAEEGDDYNNFYQYYKDRNNWKIQEELETRFEDYLYKKLKRKYDDDLGKVFLSEDFHAVNDHGQRKKEIGKLRDIYNLTNPNFTGVLQGRYKQSDVEFLFPTIFKSKTYEYPDREVFDCYLQLQNGKLSGIEFIDCSAMEEDKGEYWCSFDAGDISSEILMTNVSGGSKTYADLRKLRLYNNHQVVFESEKTDGSFNGMSTWIINGKQFNGENIFLNVMKSDKELMKFYPELLSIISFLSKLKNVKVDFLNNLSIIMRDALVPKWTAIYQTNSYEDCKQYLDLMLKIQPLLPLVESQIYCLLKLNMVEEAKNLYSKYKLEVLSDGVSIKDSLEKYLRNNKENLPKDYKTIFE